MVVSRLYDNLSRLADAKTDGRKVGQLTWEAPGEYRSFTDSQSGFKLKNTSGRTRLWLSKLGEIPLTFHRELPDGADIKTVTVKREPTGKWYAVLGVETPDDPPEKLENPEKCVGIDAGILTYPTTRTEPPLNPSTCLTNGTAWNAPNATSHGSNTGLRIGRNSAASWPNDTPP